MKLNREQCIMLIDMVNGSITMAKQSGIPIAQQYWSDIDYIKEQLYQELARANKEEMSIGY